MEYHGIEMILETALYVKTDNTNTSLDSCSAFLSRLIANSSFKHHFNIILVFFSPPPVVDDLTPEERDARTIFCMQLSQKIRAKDLEEFFSSVGKVSVILKVCF